MRPKRGPACRWIPIWVFSIALSLIAGTTQANDSVRVFAAASLKNALGEITTAWPQTQDTQVISTFAGSSILARQIQHGAPADIFISANEAWMDVLQQDNRLATGSRFNLASNQLILVSHGAGAPALDLSSENAVSGALGDGRLAMALVSAVPAGIYGKAAFESLGLWPSVRDRIAQTDNVRAALALVAAGEAPLGVVYASDARVSDAISVAATFPADSHPPIRYPAAMIRGRETPEASGFMTFLMSDAARDILARHGFSPPT